MKRPVKLKFVKERPDFACVFVARRGDDYYIFRFEWRPTDYEDIYKKEDIASYYLAWLDNYGIEYDDITECDYDEYLVLEILPNVTEVHKRLIEEQRKRLLSK